MNTAREPHSCYVPSVLFNYRLINELSLRPSDIAGFALVLCSAMPGMGQVEEISIRLPGNEAMAMVRIEPGTFLMGTTEAQAAHMHDLNRGVGLDGVITRYGGNELPIHEVTITNGFYLGKYEVTQAQWESVMGTTPWDRYSSSHVGPDKPAIAMSWLQIQEFMAKLNGEEGANYYRLPTEAEWEYATRAGTVSHWFFGDDDDLRLLADFACIGTQLCDIGTKQASPWGLYDIYGNVEEFVLDDLRAYSEDSVTDPIGVIGEVGGRPGSRGGSHWTPATNSYEDAAWGTRSSRRFSWSRDNDRLFWVGFRVFRTLDERTDISPQGWSTVKAGIEH